MKLQILLKSQKPNSKRQTNSKVETRILSLDISQDYLAFGVWLLAFSESRRKAAPTANPGGAA